MTDGLTIALGDGSRVGLLFAVSGQTVLWLLVFVLVIVGVITAATGVWLFRSSDAASDVLGPLEVMEKDKWRGADPATQRRELNSVRPRGARPLRQDGSDSAKRGKRKAEASATDADETKGVEKHDAAERFKKGSSKNGAAKHEDPLADESGDDGEGVGHQRSKLSIGAGSTSGRRRDDDELDDDSEADGTSSLLLDDDLDDEVDEGEGDTWLDRAARESDGREPRRRSRRAADRDDRDDDDEFDDDDRYDDDDLFDDDDRYDDDDLYDDDRYDDYDDDRYDDYDDDRYDDDRYDDDRYDDYDDDGYDDHRYDDAPEDNLDDPLSPANELGEADELGAMKEEPTAMQFDDMDFDNDDYQSSGRDGAAASDPFFDDDFDGHHGGVAPRPRRRAERADESGAPRTGAQPVPSSGMSSFDPEDMVQRFQERAAAVRRRPLPPVAGEERQEFIQQAKIDYQDFAMIGDAQVTMEDGVLVLRIDLRS